MAEDLWNDKESKTEEATPKKLEDALEKGQTINSKELLNFVVLLGLALFLVCFFPFCWGKICMKLKISLEHAGDIMVTPYTVGKILKSLSNTIILYLSPLFIILIILVILAKLIQQGTIVFSFETITPKLEKISLIQGFKRLFSIKSLLELLKGIIKLAIVGLFIYLIIMGEVKNLTLYQNFTVGEILNNLYQIIKQIMITVVVSVAVIAIADYFYQRYDYYQNLKMTKHEVKEEFKQTEGNPEVKKKIKSLMFEQAKRRIVDAVPKSDVVITNPTHFAVALEYDQKKMTAPTVTAKGKDLVALQIKKIAEKNSVPIVENRILAQNLYKDVEVLEFIPQEHYQAVAKIISYVYQLKQSKKSTY